MYVAMLGLLATLGLGEPDSPTVASPQTQLQNLQTEYWAAAKTYYDQSAKTRGEADRHALAETFRTNSVKLANRAFDLARDHRREDVAVDAIAWVIRDLRLDASARWGMEALVRDHLNSPRLVEACRDIGRAAPNVFQTAEETLREISRRSPRRDACGVALYQLAERLRQRADILRRIDDNPQHAERFRAMFELKPERLAKFRSRSPESLVAEAELLYEKVAADYSDLPSRRKGMTMGDLARAKLFRIRELAVGKTAPDIAFTELGGKTFHLSDYRGKVVVLTFSGTWSPPCTALYGRERDLVRDNNNRPFALLSLNVEKDPATLQKLIESGEITWRCGREEGPNAPTATHWGIDNYPMTFVIDHRGIIRRKDLRFDAVPAAVAELLKEVDAEITAAK